MKSVLNRNTCPVPHGTKRTVTEVMKNCLTCLILLVLLLAANVLCQDEFDVSADKLFGSTAGGEEMLRVAVKNRENGISGRTTGT